MVYLCQGICERLAKYNGRKPGIAPISYAQGLVFCQICQQRFTPPISLTLGLRCKCCGHTLRRKSRGRLGRARRELKELRELISSV